MKILYNIFIVVVFLFNFIYSLTDPNEALCLDTLLNKNGLSQNINVVSGEDYCSKYASVFDCDASGFVTELSFSDSTSYQYQPNDFDCFKNAPDFYQNGGDLTSDFFKNTTAINLSSFQMTNTDAVYTGVLYFSNLTKFTDFSFYGPNINVVYTNDLKTSSSFGNLFISSNIIPSSENLATSQFGIYISKWFDHTSYSNFTTYQDTFSLIIYGEYSNNLQLDFPPQLLDRASVTRTNSILFNTLNFNQPSDYLDFTKQTVQFISFTSISPSFLINGKLPLKNITSSKFYYHYSNGLTDISNIQSIVSNSDTVYLNSNNFTMNMDEFIPLINGKLQSLQLTSNKLVGTLNEKFCNLNLLGINGNQLTGTLNSCYTCHFGPALKNPMRTNLLAGFSNMDVPTVPCKTIIPNLRFDYANNRTYLFGRDLGFGVDIVYFQTTPTARWYNDVPSESFYKLGTETSSFDIYFRFPGLMFHVTATPQQPIINNIYVSNDGNLTINGTNFNYNTSLIKVGDGETKCIVTYATFYQIFCSLESFNSSIIIPNAKTNITIDQLTTTVPVTIKPDYLNQYLPCNFTCEPNGYCNTLTGECSCNQDFHGETCSIQQHYVSSIEHSILENNGGTVTLSGLFTETHNNLTITIGEFNCQVTQVNETTIICDLLSGGSGIQTTTVLQNGLLWSSKNSFEYLTTTKPCPNNCTSNSNGKCNTLTGYCNCINDYKGPDCSYISNTIGSNDLPPSNSSINEGSGSAIISNQEVLYDILIIKLVEYNINGQEVRTIDLQNKWILDNDQSNNNVSVFSQVVDNYYNSIIKSRFEIVDKDTDYSFAGIDFFIESGSIKISIDISNYKYLSNLNTIQIQIQSNVTEDLNKKENNCNNKETSIEGFDDSKAINYLSIEKNGRVLSGKLINYALSDSRPTLISSSIVERSPNGIIVGINLPHFSTTCSIDPDFQVLLQTTFKTSCETSRASYIIPLSVVLPVVAVASIVGATIFFIKKRKDAKEFNNIQSKSKKMNS